MKPSLWRRALTREGGAARWTGQAEPPVALAGGGGWRSGALWKSRL